MDAEHASRNANNVDRSRDPTHHCTDLSQPPDYLASTAGALIQRVTSRRVATLMTLLESV